MCQNLNLDKTIRLWEGPDIYADYGAQVMEDNTGVDSYMEAGMILGHCIQGRFELNKHKE